MRFVCEGWVVIIDGRIATFGDLGHRGSRAKNFPIVQAHRKYAVGKRSLIGGKVVKVKVTIKTMEKA